MYFRVPTSNRAPLGWLHVRKIYNRIFLCSAGSACDRQSIGVGKKTKTKTRCPHEELCRLLNDDVEVNLEDEEIEEKEVHSGERAGDEDLNIEESEESEGHDEELEENSESIGLKFLKETSKWMFENKKINFTDEYMRDISKQILDRNKRGWPSIFQPEETKCAKCQSDLGDLQRHQGSSRAFLFTAEFLRPVTVLVRKCKNCFLLYQAKHPLCLNIGDNLIVTLDRMFLMRSIVHTCAPISTAASILVDDVSKSCDYAYSLNSHEKEWIIRRLTAGLLAIEALDNDEEYSQICALCGKIPDLTLSDGGEDICVTLLTEHLDISPGHEDGTFTPENAQKFYDALKIFHIGALIYPGLQFKRNFKCNVSNTPPFVLKAYQGPLLYNTETQKDPTFLDAKMLQGEQQLLIHMLQEGEFCLEELNDDNMQRAKAGRLSELLAKMGFAKRDIAMLKSNMQKKKAIMNLYESITSGYRSVI